MSRTHSARVQTRTSTTVIIIIEYISIHFQIHMRNKEKCVLFDETELKTRDYLKCL